MTARLRHPAPADPVVEAARVLGKLGGRPRGSFSSPLARWLRAEVAQRKDDCYGCAEAFGVVREAEIPAGKKSLHLTDATMDRWGIEAKEDEDGNDLPVTVSLSYWKNIWSENFR
jgi:hypothetical protein